MNLKPSDIRYSQDSINNFFRRHSNHGRTKIGETLDALCEGRCSIDNIKKITVVNKDGHWVTLNNRRLWVFRELERLGKCVTIPVLTEDRNLSGKETSRNGGESIIVRRPPGGLWHEKPSVPKPTDKAPVELLGGSYALANSNETSQPNPSGFQSTFVSSFQATTTPTDQSLISTTIRKASESIESCRVQSNFDSTEKYSTSPQNAGLDDQMNTVTTKLENYESQSIPSNGSGSSALEDPHTFGTARRSDTTFTSTSLSHQKGVDERVSRFSYGIRITMPYKPNLDPIEKRVIRNGKERCRGRFSKLIGVGQAIIPGRRFGKKYYTWKDGGSRRDSLVVYKSAKKKPRYVDDPGCSRHGRTIAIQPGILKEEKRFAVEMLCDENGQNLILEVTQNNGEVVYKKIVDGI